MNKQKNERLPFKTVMAYSGPDTRKLVSGHAHANTCSAYQHPTFCVAAADNIFAHALSNQRVNRLVGAVHAPLILHSRSLTAQALGQDILQLHSCVVAANHNCYHVASSFLCPGFNNPILVCRRLSAVNSFYSRGSGSIS